MKINKKLSVLALGLTLLLGVGAPVTTHAIQCNHSPYSAPYSTSYTAYTHASQYGTCYVTRTEQHSAIRCSICGTTLSDNVTSTTDRHSQPHG